MRFKLKQERKEDSLREKNLFEKRHSNANWLDFYFAIGEAIVDYSRTIVDDTFMPENDRQNNCTVACVLISLFYF